MAKRPLNPRQQAFVDAYLIEPNGTQAAVTAGYSKKNACVVGSENLRKPYIKKAIEQAQAKRAAVVEINAEWVLRQAVKVHERCLEAVPVMEKIDGEWVESGVYKFDSSGANKALELVGKHIGVQAFNERQTLEIGVRTMSDEDLMKQIHALENPQIIEHKE